MRQNIKLVYSDSIVDEPSNRNVEEKNVIYLYSHWGGGEEGESELEDKLRTALAKRWRWGDESYLARIIVSEVLKDDIDGETGYGIAPYECDPEFPTLVVDLREMTVNGVSFEEFIKE